MNIQIIREPVFHIIIHDLLPEEENAQIFKHIVSLEKNYHPSAIGEDEAVQADYRSNLNINMDQLYALPNEHDQEKVAAHRSSSPLLKFIDGFIQNEKWISMFDSAPWPLHELRFCDYWSSQVSRYGQNDHYHWHYDSIPWDSTRILTMIYYVHSTPKMFEGGELYLTNGLLFEDQVVGASSEVAIEPKNNRLVFFDSRTVHTVKKTSSPEKFDQGRFSVNVWIGKYGE